MYKQIKDVRDAPNVMYHDPNDRDVRYDMQNTQPHTRQHINPQMEQSQYYDYQSRNMHDMHTATDPNMPAYAPNDTLFQDTGDYSEFQKYLPKELRGSKLVKMTPNEMQQYGMNSGAAMPIAAGDQRTNGVSIRKLDMGAGASQGVTGVPSVPSVSSVPTLNQAYGGYGAYEAQDPSMLQNKPTIKTDGPFLVLETREHMEAVLSSHKVVVVTHVMDGCGAYKMFRPNLEALAVEQTQRYGDTVRFVLVNAQSTELNEGITAFPTTLIYLSGNQLRKYKGAGFAKKIGKVVADAVYV